MKRMLNPALMGSFISSMALAAADADTGTTVDTGADAGDGTGTTTTEPAAPKNPLGAAARTMFTPEQIAEIRNLRSEKHPEGHAKAGTAVHSHKALALRFQTSAGVISQIVRNRTYKDPDYVPTNDGK